MSVFVQDTGLTLCLWILGSIVVVIALLLLSVFDGKREELRETVVFPEGSLAAAVADALIAPQERLRKLEGKISTKCAKLEISQEKLEETKRTISELEVTSGEVQVKYQELLKQLKAELAKTEKECQHLHDQIEKITTKRDKLKQELDEVGSVLKVSKVNSTATFDEETLSYDSRLGKTGNFLNQDVRTMSDHASRSHMWLSDNKKFKFSVEGISSGF